jgi:hypothetical protein
VPELEFVLSLSLALDEAVVEVVEAVELAAVVELPSSDKPMLEKASAMALIMLSPGDGFAAGPEGDPSTWPPWPVAWVRDRR